MARNYYSEAENIARLLEGTGLGKEAESLRQAIAEGSTGTEILVALRWHLQRIDKSNAALLPQTRQQSWELAEAIEAVLSV